MKRLALYLWNLWPPFWGAGIAIDAISADLKFARIRLKRRPWTRNIVGTQFGGSIYAMTDPIYMTMLMMHLGRDYIVWDKAASIRFRKPGRSDLFAEFSINDADVADIKQRLTTEPKLDWQRSVLVKDKAGEVIAEIEKVIHVRRKQ
jgi:acyl-coenzyme A thioesterase PaaI-like protein